MKIEPQAWQVFLFSSPLYEPLEDQTTITPSNQAMLKIGFYAFTMLLQLLNISIVNFVFYSAIIRVNMSPNLELKCLIFMCPNCWHHNVHGRKI